MNKSCCNLCHALVPANREERDGKIFLVKDCQKCGRTETLISSDAARYNSKRALDTGYPYRGCALNCPNCHHDDQRMSFAFVDVTLRCNLNCPICIDNVPGLGFTYEPPIEYFDRIFQHLSQYDRPPTVCLFGGEPTVRDDLFDIIRLSRSYGLRTRVFTNGLKLADEQYCRKLVESRATLLVAYDGANPETYRKLRGSAEALELKQKAVENVRKFGRRGRALLITCVAKGVNDREMPELIEFYHRQRSVLSGVYLMPLAHTWEPSGGEFEPDRITTEDVEARVDEAFPDHEIEFLPAGFVAEFSKMPGYFGKANVPFLGAHPNCESICILLSDGEKYLPLAHYARGSVMEAAKALLEVEKRLAERERKWHSGLVGRALGRLHLRRAALGVLAVGSMLPLVLRYVRIGRLLKGKGLAKVGHGLLLPIELALGRSRRTVLQRRTNVQALLQLIVLPFEDNYMLETDRLERCPNVHVYFDPRTEQVRYVPVCAWRLHNKAILQNIAQYYASGAPPAGAKGAEEKSETGVGAE